MKERKFLMKPIFNGLDKLTTIYHFTNWSGLNGILESKNLRATFYKNLNDTTELTHGREVLKNIFSEKEIKVDSSFFTTSFCRNKYNLHAWKEYADNGKGVAIGFNVGKLSECIEKLIPNFFEKLEVTITEEASKKNKKGILIYPKPSDEENRSIKDWNFSVNGETIPLNAEPKQIGIRLPKKVDVIKKFDLPKDSKEKIRSYIINRQNIRFFFEPVEYLIADTQYYKEDMDRIEETLKTWVDKFYNEDCPSLQKEKHKTSSELLSALLNLFPALLKHPTFKGEEETRIIIENFMHFSPEREINHKVVTIAVPIRINCKKYCAESNRCGSPYMEIDFSDHLDVIDEILIGPNICRVEEKSLRKKLLDNFENYGYNLTEQNIKKQNIPYRDWNNCEHTHDFVRNMLLIGNSVEEIKKLTELDYKLIRQCKAELLADW